MSENEKVEKSIPIYVKLIVIVAAIGLLAYTNPDTSSFTEWKASQSTTRSIVQEERIRMRSTRSNYIIFSVYSYTQPSVLDDGVWESRTLGVLGNFITISPLTRKR